MQHIYQTILKKTKTYSWLSLSPKCSKPKFMYIKLWGFVKESNSSEESAEFPPSKELTNTNAAFTIINPLTPISDQERISPYNIKQTSDENKEKS